MDAPGIKIPMEDVESSDDMGYSSNVRLGPKEENKVDEDCGCQGDCETSVAVQDKPSQCCSRLRFKGEKLIVALTIAGVIIGIMVGFAIRTTEPSQQTIELVKFPGELLMRMLKMLIIPIIATSIVTGLANLDMKKSGRMGGHAISYYLVTTICAVILGIILVIIIHPGNSDQKKDVNNEEEAKEVSSLDTYLDLLRNLFPENIIAACFEVVRSKRIPMEANEVNTTLSWSNLTDVFDNSTATQNVSASVPEFTKSLERVHNTNVLGVIAFFIAFGVTLSSLGEEGRSVTVMFSVFNRIFMRLISIVIWYSPLGICSLIAGNIAELDNLQVLAESVGMYMITVITGLLIHGVIVLPLIFWVVTRQNPYRFAMGMTQALLTALGTASSAGTLPITMRCLENNLGIDKRVTQFVLPLGATMNMDGTALLEGVAAITIAQMYNMTLSFGQIVTISLTATLASIGAAAIPSAGLVTLVLVLTAIGIPTEAVAVIWSIDWFLDRLRTAVNVFGDCVGAAIVQHMNKEHLNDIEQQNAKKSAGICVRISEEGKSLLLK